MASGKSAEIIYSLLYELGGSEVSSKFVLQDLIKYMSGDDIKDFVEYFRRNHNMQNNITEDIERNEFVLCMDCQDTHHEDDDHQCHQSSSVFFSSLIPEC